MDDLAIGRLRRALAADRATAAERAAGSGSALTLDPDGTDVWAAPAPREVPGRRPEEASGNHLDDAVVVTGADLTIHWAARAVTDMLGYAAGELDARSARALVHPADHAAVTEAVDRVLADPRRTERLVARLRDRQERWRWVDGTVHNRLDDPGVRGLVAHLRDVTDRVRAEDEHRLSRALHEAMVETAQEGIVVTAPDGTTSYANAAMAQLLGRPLELLYGSDVVAGLLSEQVGTDPGAEPGSWRREVGYRHPEGSERLFEVAHTPLSREGDPALGSLVTVSDITETRRAESALRRRALYDALTGLPNRYLLLDRLEMAAARQSRNEGAGTAVLFLDLDGLKPVNDRYGHDAGDQLLREVGARLARSVRASDTVGRHGGDEFVIVCEDIDEAGALSVAARVQAAMRPPVELEAVRTRVGASIGVALSPPCDPADILRWADAAMYHAKKHGGGRVAVAVEHGDGPPSWRLVAPPD